MNGGLVVVGGADGTDASYDDMLAASRFLRQAADEIESVVAACGWHSLMLAGEDPDVDVWGALIARDSLESATSAVNYVQSDLWVTATFLRAAVDKYTGADSSVLGTIEGLVAGTSTAAWHFASATGKSAPEFFRGDLVGAMDTFATDDPAAVDAVVDLASVTAYALLGSERALLIRLTKLYFDDGDPAVTSLGLDTRTQARRAPRGLADLMAGVGLREGGKAGEVDVKVLTGPGGTRHVIVDITGTKDWSVVHETPNVAGWATNIRAVGGTPTTYEKGVLDAMTRAGVRPTDDVMVVGHSLGGLIATTLARDAKRSGRFNVTHVVTAGAPIGRFVSELPDDVQVLALENKHDPVPHLDGENNPRPTNITTVTIDYDNGSIGADHGIDTAYLPGAAEADASDDAAIRAFLTGAGGYFNATSVQTRAYVITRR